MFSVIATMFSLCFSTIAEFYSMEVVSPDFLSTNSITIDIGQSDSQDQVTIKDLINYSSTQTDILIYRDYPISMGKAVFLSGETDFNLELVSGRSFMATDFAQQAPVAIVSETALDNCIERNGELYLVHDNDEYSIIGVFESSQTAELRRNTQYYVNMTAAMEAPLDGTYLLDAKTESMKIFDGLSTNLKQINPDLQIRAYANAQSTAHSLVQAINNSMIVNLIFALAAFLVLLNAFSVTYYWIEGRFKELAVRIMTGARIPRVRRMMLGDYLAIVTCSYGLGTVISILIIKSGFFPFIGETVHFLAIVAGYLICLVAGLFIGWISLTARLKQDVILQIRG